MALTRSIVLLGFVVFVGMMMATPKTEGRTSRHHSGYPSQPPPSPAPPPSAPVSTHEMVLLLTMVPVSILTLVVLVFLGFHLYLGAVGATTKALVAR